MSCLSFVQAITVDATPNVFHTQHVLIPVDGIGLVDAQGITLDLHAMLSL